ncbi:hypothetical protein HanIR_Chr15g0734361 [Helianthus annuus]|nr:hypothetical protein HanIR_Chr15g0734361 [Helianthus annuus]
MLAAILSKNSPPHDRLAPQSDNPSPKVINMFSSTVLGTGDQNGLVVSAVRLVKNLWAVGVSLKAGRLGSIGVVWVVFG